MGGQPSARLRGQGPEAGGGRRRRGHRCAASSSGSSGSARRRCWRGNCGRRASAPSAASSIDKGYLYKLLNNRTYLGLGRAQGRGVPRRARGDHRAGAVGQGARDPRREHPHPLGEHPGADAGAAEGADLRADRRGDVADAHPQGQPALPLLRQPGRAEARAGGLPGRTRARRPRSRRRSSTSCAAVFRQPEIVVGTWRAARAEQDDVTEDEAREALHQLDPLWDELFPAEQARIVQLLVERVTVKEDALEIRIRAEGIGSLLERLAPAADIGRRAA